jgi:endonuclease/exonuclease/phosphatase family metal-dependent hydrolase
MITKALLSISYMMLSCLITTFGQQPINSEIELIPASFKESSPIDEPLLIQNKKNLKILSWNIYMLPPAILETAKRQRAKAIATELDQTDYDILVFQEAFHSAARNILRAKLHHLFPHSYGPANHKGIKFNSGIWILSKIPLKPVKEIKYKKCTGYDCYSQKGAILMEGNKSGEIFQLIGTHLQSEGPQEIRQSQYEEIYNELVVPYQKRNVPQIICGDFNTSSSDQCSYDDMVCTLDCENGKLDGKTKNTYKGGNDQIDYILLRKNGCIIKHQHREIKEFFHAWFGKKNKYIQSPDLSDHNAMEIDIEF